MATTYHATALLFGAKAVLLFGASGAGKSRLCYDLLQSNTFTRLIGDDRVYLEAHHGRLLVKPAEHLKGLLEVRGVGILHLPFEPQAQVLCCVELVTSSERLPLPMTKTLCGLTIPSFTLQSGLNAKQNLLAFLDEKIKNL